MSEYCHIENNVIDEGPKTLPTSWRNISGLHHQNAAELKKLGWLPVRRVGFESFDSAVQVRTGPAYAIEPDEVVATYTVRDKTAQELNAEKDAIASQITERGLLRAYVLAINDGSIVPGSNMGGAALKAAIKAKL